MFSANKIRYLTGAAIIGLAWVPCIQVANASEIQQDPAGTTVGEVEEQANSAEIVVTATKRAERLQDVPQSVSAFSEADISARGLRDMDDYLRSVPGVNFVKSGTRENAIVIRGIETSPSDQNYSAGTTVATYFGETPITDAAGIGGGSGIDMKLVDVARIEVLRGPQGSTFGDASLGGAVRTIPNLPDLDELSGNITGDFSDTARHGGTNYGIEGAINVPIVKSVFALRAVGYRFKDSGFYKYEDVTKPEYQAILATYGGEFADPRRDVLGHSIVNGYRLSALISTGGSNTLLFSYAHQDAEQDGPFALASVGNYGQLPLYKVNPESIVRGREEGVSDYDIDIFNATYQHDFGWADFTATASYVDSKTVLVSTSDTTQVPYSSLSISNYEAFSQEIRLASKLNGPFQFLVGGYAEQKDATFLQDFYWIGDQSLNIFGTPGPHLGVIEDLRKSDQIAAFGELTYRPVENLKITAGGRYYHYDREVTVLQGGDLFGTPFDDPFSSVNTIKKSGHTLKASIDYKVADNAMIYAAWSQGFRLGRPAAGLPAGICDLDDDGVLDGTDVTIESTRNIDSDKLDNYEAGVKTSWLNGRVVANASVFRIKWRGLPIRVNANCDGVDLAYVDNVGAATSTGVELQGSVQASPNLRFDFGASYTDAELSRDAPGLGAKGDRLPGSPAWNANLGAQVDFSLFAREAYIRADSVYSGTFYGDLAQSANTKVDDYITVDLRAGMKVGAAQVTIYARNLLNADNFTWRGIFDSGNPDRGFRLRPRTIGIRVGYDF